MDLLDLVSQATGTTPKQVKNVISLLFDNGATIPFVSRYRKEATGGLDEVAIGKIKEEYERLTELEKRKTTVLTTIEEQGKLTPELKGKIESCYNSAVLEDLYLPYKPKRRTRASIAKERGLEPLAAMLIKQNHPNIEQAAYRFINDAVPSAEEALAGALDITAEWISENEKARSAVRRIFAREAQITSKVIKGKEEEGIKYADYYAFSEPLKRSPSHRILAMIRGEREGVLKLSAAPDDCPALEALEQIFLKASPSDNLSSHYIRQSIADSYKRLIKPSMETEFLAAAKERADTEAIRVFSENLRQLLLSPPLGQHSILAIDPGFRTGCKVVCLDKQGNLLHNETIFPHPPQNETGTAIKKIVSLTDMYKIEAIAIGDGTASRETESFIKRIRFNRELRIFMVSEDGASVYSASPAAREEFPSYDVTVRGAVSIGRRLMDPLAELVKIEPKAIGVGQYQHDVEQSRLKKSLDAVVESCVNMVGVNLNTASKHLLTYVSGIGASLAANIVAYRRDNGAFRSREELKKVPRLGDKAFEQCAGFLRISGGTNPLDNSAVHPESYPIVQRMADDNGVTIAELLDNKELQARIDITRYADDKTGIPTLTDIMQELKKPGRDPRNGIKVFEFNPDIRSIDDLKEGMVLPGIVTNITNFGAFVDIGIKQDGLVHISQLADRYVANPADIVKLHQQVEVRVLEIDKTRNRIQLSMKNMPGK